MRMRADRYFGLCYIMRYFYYQLFFCYFVFFGMLTMLLIKSNPLSLMYSISFVNSGKEPMKKMTSKESLECINSPLTELWWIKSSYLPANKMLRYVSRDATLFIQSFVKLWSCSVDHHCRCNRVGHQEDGEYTVRQMSSGMYNQESFSLPKCCQCNAQSVWWEKGKRGRSDLSKAWSEFGEAALVTTWGADRMIF